MGRLLDGIGELVLCRYLLYRQAGYRIFSKEEEELVSSLPTPE